MIDNKLYSTFNDSIVDLCRFSHVVHDCGIVNIPEFLVLHCIATGKNKDGKYMVTYINNRIDMAMPNTVRLLNDIQEKGYVERCRDGRTVYVSLTDEGKKFHGECMKKLVLVMDKIVAALEKCGVSDEEFNSFMLTAIKLNGVYNLL